MKIFVSYTSRDSSITYKVLYNIYLKLSGISEVYVDIINNDSLNRQERVILELDSSDVVILILSENVYKSYWVNLELERAKINNIPVIKLTTDEILIKSIEQLEKMLSND